ncbi:MAG TPA: ATP-binding protein [Steroidobacteraceae bacterium]|jgi:two-component system OmpR family sensor kinase
MKSLRTRLLVWLLGGVILLGAAGGWMVYRNALAEADAFFDYHLRQTALLLRDQPVEYMLGSGIPPADADYDFVVQVWSLNGILVYLSRPHAVLPAITTLGFSTASTSEGRWRVYGVQAVTRVIQVAQPMSVRERQAADLALRTLLPFAFLMPLLAMLIWFVVGHALRPLQGLTQLVKARRVTALTPLPDERLPAEVQPLVAALNDLLQRLGAALERERGFMADAAHELRTPLTALHLQMSTLARAGSEAERVDAMERLTAGVQRAIRLVEQLLSLARQEPRTDPPRARVRLDEIARAVVAEMVPLADARHIDLGISNSEPAVVLGDADALRTLIRNLVDNAVRYSPEGGRIDVSVATRPEQEGTGGLQPNSLGELKPNGLGDLQANRPPDPPANSPGSLLRVLDTGPGIPENERRRVFDRFYRQPGTAPPGSGLGMAIVKAIADAHEAEVRLDSGPGGLGLAVTITFAPT